MTTGDQRTDAALGGLRDLLVLSNLMLACDSRDEILRLMLSSLPELTVFRQIGVYLATSGLGAPDSHVTWSGPPTLIGDLDQLAGADAALEVAGAGEWTWAYSMRSAGNHHGYLVVCADAEPKSSDRFLLAVLAQQTATALTAAQQAATLQAANEARALASARLEVSVNALLRRTHAHELMTDAAIHGDTSDLAKAAYSLTRLPVAIVDQFGYLQTSADDGASPSIWADVRMPTSRNLAAAGAAGRSIRLAKFLLAAAKPGGEVLGGVVLLDTAHTAGEFESYVLERTVAQLTGELAHRRALAEMEARLHRELLVELVEGLDEDEACTRAALLGHDLHQPHQVAAIRCGADLDQAWMEIALRRAGSQDGSTPLVGQRRGLLLAIVRNEADAQRLHEGLKQVRGDVAISIGLGGDAGGPAELPRSYAEALRALRVRERSAEPDGGTDFSELGLYQILEDRDRGAAVDTFVARWLGALIDYDTVRHTELVNTLTRFLDCGGNYDLAAQALLIHRSTLRYRLRRIRDVGGLDLADVETRLNVHVATRAWRVLGNE